MQLKMKLLLVLKLATLFILASANDYYDDYNDEDDELPQNHDSCDHTNCVRPNCSCFGTVPIYGQKLPQFVMVTFDDAITTLNIKTYRRLYESRTNPNGCPISMTFFASHEYNDYEFVNELYKKGHEIAVHSITHESSTEMWKSASHTRWLNEITGMRTILSHVGLVPASEIVGHRAPFLQTAGDVTFQVLKEEGFAYDSSMPTRAHMDPPLWPYTLDHGYRQDCQIQPCPRSNFSGLWNFPMVQWDRKSRIGQQVVTFHCSMLDACTPYPVNASDTLAYMLDNFERHYTSNRAPFPVFLHEAWLRDTERLRGFERFLDSLSKKDDVFVVSMREVLEYMKSPLTVEEYKAHSGCYASSRPKAGECKPKVCNYPKRKILMKSCIPCPKRFPWLGNPEGVKKSIENVQD